MSIRFGLCFTLILFLASVSQSVFSNDGFSIKGAVSGEIPDQKITLQHWGKVSGKTSSLLEANIVNGKFRLEGIIDNPPAIYRIGLESSGKGTAFKNSWIVLSNLDMTMTIGVKENNEKGTYLEYSLSGGPVENDLFSRFSSEIDSMFSDPFWSLIERKSALKTRRNKTFFDTKIEIDNEIKSIDEEIEGLAEKQNTYLEEIVVREKENFKSLLALRGLFYSLKFPYKDPGEVEKRFSILSPSIADSEIAKVLKVEMLDYAKKIQRSSSVGEVGSDFMNFVQYDTESNPVIAEEHLKSGGYLLLDFWQSTCAPCRAEFPHIKSVYAKYHKKGFEVIAISLDQDRYDWLDAIEEDEIPWINVGDFHDWGNPVATLYGVISLPSNILIDSNGKIVAKNLKGKALERFLSEKFDN